MLGTLVGYVKEPRLYGPMMVTGVRKDGKLDCKTEDGTAYIFEPHEVEDAGQLWTAPSVAAFA